LPRSWPAEPGLNSRPLCPLAPAPSPLPLCAPQHQEEERHHNENALTTLVCDSVSAMVLATMVVRDVDGRAALANTFGRLFEGLSDIAKAVLIILVAGGRWGTCFVVVGCVGRWRLRVRAGGPWGAERRGGRLRGVGFLGGEGQAHRRQGGGREHACLRPRRARQGAAARTRPSGAAPCPRPCNAPPALPSKTPPPNPHPHPPKPDTMLGYHSEEGWTGLIDVIMGHYGIELEEKDIVLFVGIIPSEGASRGTSCYAHSC
jgi:hypothetical protein